MRRHARPLPTATFHELVTLVTAHAHHPCRTSNSLASLRFSSTRCRSSAKAFAALACPSFRKVAFPGTPPENSHIPWKCLVGRWIVLVLYNGLWNQVTCCFILLSASHAAFILYSEYSEYLRHQHTGICFVKRHVSSNSRKGSGKCIKITPSTS